MLTDFFRIFRIARILVKHDALWIFVAVPRLSLLVRGLAWVSGGGRIVKVDSPKGKRLAEALQELGPIFIKFGQVLSVRSDLLGAEVAHDLATLQDKLPPFGGDEAEAIIEQSLGSPPNHFFCEFDKVAIAAASIAQVHRAKTHAGEVVAVKILRPNIEQAFRRDVRLFKRLSRILHYCVPHLRRLHLREGVAMFESWVKVEMDLTLEAAAAAKMAENFEKRTEKIHIPKVFWPLCAPHVLTTEWIDGFRIDDIQAIEKAGLSLQALQENSARIFFMQIFYDGFFHADMHPGNIFVRKDGVIVPVDFGIMGHVDRRTRAFLADLLLGFFHRDYQRIAEAHFGYGIVPPQESAFAFALAMRTIGDPLIDLSLNEISVGKLLSRLFGITSQFNMQTQPQLLLLQKTIFMAEALGRNLNAEVNMWVLARPLIEDWILLNHSPEAKLWRILKQLLQWGEDYIAKASAPPQQ